MVAEPITIGRQTWTYSDLDVFKDDIRRELHHGVIFEMPSPKTSHQLACRMIQLFLELWIRAGGNGLIYPHPTDLRLRDDTVFIPDLSYYATEVRAEVEDSSNSYLVAAPDLIVEVISPSTAGRDRVLKYREYAAFGVKQYWIIDPEAQTLHAFVLQDGHYREEAALIAGETFTPAGFPGLSITLNELFGLPADHPAPVVTRDVPLTSR